MKNSMPWRARRALLLAAVLPSLALVPSSGRADTWPSKPIRLICPFPPGGAVDIASRAIAAELQNILGQPVAVDNRPGAGGNIGGTDAATSPPDGYTLFMTTSGIQAINPSLYRNMGFDPNKDLAPVSVLVSLSNVLVVNPQVKANTAQELLALIKAKPGELNFASSGTGTSIHMSGEMYKYLTGAKIIHVPYKGSAPAVTDLLGGQVMMMFDNIPSSLPYIKAGKLRALATTGAKRDPALPDVPTLAETGIKGYESGVWFGLSVPAATPKDIVARLSQAAVKGTQAPSFLKRMGDLGYRVLGTTPEVMARMQKEELERWPPVVKAAGLQPN